MTDAEKMVGDAVAKLVAQQQSDGSKKFAAFESLLTEIGQALSDVVAAMESDNKGDDEAIAKALTAGLKNLRIDVKVAAPNITVKVDPTPINNVVNLPELKPVIHIMEREPVPQANVTHDIEIKYGSGGLPQSMTITRRIQRK